MSAIMFVIFDSSRNRLHMIGHSTPPGQSGRQKYSSVLVGELTVPSLLVRNWGAGLTEIWLLLDIEKSKTIGQCQIRWMRRIESKYRVYLGTEFKTQLGSMRTGIVHMENQMSSHLTPERCGEFRKLWKHRWKVAIGTQLLPFQEGCDSVKLI
jgi:hypothetical protein